MSLKKEQDVESDQRRGRLRGEPSTPITVRVPYDLLERLDRYLDRVAYLTGMKGNRNLAIRSAIIEWLDQREEMLNNPPATSESPAHPTTPKKRPRSRRDTPQSSDPDDAC